MQKARWWGGRTLVPALMPTGPPRQALKGAAPVAGVLSCRVCGTRSMEAGGLLAHAPPSFCSQVETEDRFEWIGGSSIGGGTFWGLGALLTKTKVGPCCRKGRHVKSHCQVPGKGLWLWDLSPGVGWDGWESGPFLGLVLTLVPRSLKDGHPVARASPIWAAPPSAPHLAPSLLPCFGFVSVGWWQPLGLTCRHLLCPCRSLMSCCVWPPGASMQMWTCWCRTSTVGPTRPWG